MKKIQIMTKDDKGNEVPMLSKEDKEMYNYSLEEGDLIVPLKDSVYTKMIPYFNDNGIEEKFAKHSLLVSFEGSEIFLDVNLEIKRVLESLLKSNLKIIGQPFKAYIRTNMNNNKVMSIGRFDESKIVESKSVESKSVESKSVESKSVESKTTE